MKKSPPNQATGGSKFIFRENKNMVYLIPKAKKNLHQCEYHLKLMEGSRNIEEIEINFAAFVTSARSVTFVLQKEFSKNQHFIKWYGEKDNPKKGTKRYEMNKDPLCKFFAELRNSIEKEGISGIEAVNTRIQSFNSSTDIVDKPEDFDHMLIGANGIFFSVHSNTPKADIIPANTTAKLSTVFILKNTPGVHLGKDIKDKNFFEISKLYFEYLKSIVEEFTGIVNS